MILADIIDFWLEEKGYKLVRISHVDQHGHYFPACTHWTRNGLSVIDVYSDQCIVYGFRLPNPSHPDFFKALEERLVENGVC